MRFPYKKKTKKAFKMVFAFLPHKCSECKDTIWLEEMTAYRHVFRWGYCWYYYCVRCEREDGRK